MRGNKSTSDIDCYISIESGQWKGERVLRWGKRRGAGYEFLVGIQRHPQVLGLTIIDDDTRDAKHLFYFSKGIDHIVGLGEVARDVQLVVGAVGLLQ